MKVQSIVYVLVLTLTVFGVEKDPKIENVLSLISKDSIWNLVDTLSTFERYTTETDAYQCTEYLKTYLNQFNFDDISVQEFKANNTPNIILEKTGTLYPNKYHVIGAHYDSYAPASPGADDNASGTAVLMEIARAISEATFESSVILIFFSGEEIGLLGSKYYAAKAAQENMDIQSMINLDVIGYLEPGTDLIFDCSYNGPSQELYDTLLALMPLYVPGVGVEDASSKTFYASSDHRSFWDNNYKALFFAEELNRYSQDFNNYWHTDNDILGLSCNSKELMLAVAQSTLALTAHKAVIAEAESIKMSSKSTETKQKISVENRVLTLHKGSTSAVEISLFNVKGQQLLSENNQSTKSNLTLSLQQYPSGMYLMKVKQDGVVKTFSFIL